MSASLVTRRVVKLGGSLLSLPDCALRFRAWLATQPTAETLLITGGGSLADEVREANRLQPLTESAAHWLCVRAMQTQTEQLAPMLTEAVMAEPVAALRLAPPRARLAIVDPWRFVREEDPRFSPAALPESWDVTSDSIAARLAQLTAAQELVLLKSASALTADLSVLAASGFVDRFFPTAARDVPHVRLVNLRATDARDVVLRPAEAGNDRSNQTAVR